MLWRVVGLAVVSAMLSGCGMQMRRLQEQEMVMMESVSRSYPAPSHRVAVATFEAMRRELASSDFSSDSEFLPGPKPKNPNAPRFTEGKPLPPNFPAFWVDYQAGGQRVSQLLMLGACHFKGKTRQGRDVTVDIRFTPGDGTVVTVHIDGDDRSASKSFLATVEDRLNNPSNPPGSLEEAAMLKAFFGGVQSRESIPSLRQTGVATTTVKAKS